ncbi:LacI family DNA-binding transcriptional regulator [Actinotalea sp. K2]|uniref:LacI family DNA-binding transcriptional regulator n=1 Tax=Actinotalea sp. K2 TaxID=2939438 RepID=UPI0020181359|nr:LacI family DNA-binding transcriptional regulator [Actinotalea sp. K2]MCL3861798.1 LacI family transcriptional regulator [Actinotalea sp. K2]
MPERGAAHPPSIYDVARAAGVSTATVSRTFSRPGRVGAETAERVLAAAATLGYRARLHTQRGSAPTGMIALLLTDIANPGYLEIIRGCEDAASAAGFTLLLANTQESAARERVAMERAIPNVDGLVLTSSRMTDSAIRQIAKQRPMVVLNRAVQGVPSVVHDNVRGMRYALTHLAELGHRQVTYVAGPEASWADGLRWSSLRTVAAELGVRVRRVGPVAPTVEGGVQGAALWGEHPTSGVVAFNDLVAVGFIHAARASGNQTPDDVSVVGFDNANVAELVSPRLTTVASPLHAVGETAVRNVIALIGGASSWTGEPLVLPTKLVVRESTGRAPG